SPSSCVHSLAEIDPGRPPLGVVGGISGFKQVPGLQVRPGAMVESSRAGIEDEWCCGIAHALLRHLYRGHHSCGTNQKNPPCNLPVPLAGRSRKDTNASSPVIPPGKESPRGSTRREEKTQSSPPRTVVRETIEIVGYDPSWPSSFRQEAKHLRSVLPP